MYKAGDKMKPSEQAKAAGLKDLNQVAKQTGQSAQTLINWHRNKPELFATIIAGCVALRQNVEGVNIVSEHAHG